MSSEQWHLTMNCTMSDETMLTRSWFLWTMKQWTMKNTMSDEVILRKPKVLRTMAFNDDGTMSGETVNNEVWVVVGV